MNLNPNDKRCTECGQPKERDCFHKDKYKADGLCSVCKRCKRASTRRHYESNRDGILTTRRRLHHENATEINRSRRKHPDIEGQGTFNRVNPTHFDFGASNRKPPGVASFARLVKQYKTSAKVRGLSFDLSNDSIAFLTKSDCAYCGVEPAQRMESRDSNGPYIYNGIDRIDSSKGYSLNNCAPCCKVCNRAKLNMPEAKWLEWLARIVRFHTAAQVGFKKTLAHDEVPKSLAAA